jgi:hypothetical protein
MRCPTCDLPMNRHAEKPLRHTSDDHQGEVVAAIYCCAGCGKVEAEVVPL